MADRAGLESRLILDAYPSDEALAELLAAEPRFAGRRIMPTVLQVRLDGRVHYCCWAGGDIDARGEVMTINLTLPGSLAVDALLRLPGVGEGRTLIFQQLKLGPTPLRDKIIASLRAFPVSAPVCFVGDLAGELDGQMSLAFNVVGVVQLQGEGGGDG